MSALTAQFFIYSNQNHCTVLYIFKPKPLHSSLYIQTKTTAQFFIYSKHLAKRSEHRSARILYGELSETMRHARIWTAKRHSERERYRYRSDMLERMDSIIQRYMSGDDAMAAFGRTLENARNSMFTFVIHPDVPSTNNGAENAIRKCVMHRNARG